MIRLFSQVSMWLACFAAAVAGIETARGQYMVERVASGLDRPVFAAQAPSDDDTLYIAEQRVEGQGRFGQIVALDLTTGEQSQFLRIDGIATSSEGGLHGFAFHPEFATNGRLYVSWIEQPSGGLALSRLDEYVFSPQEGTVQHARLLYREPTFNQAYHMIDWIGFDPTATGAANDYLYVTLGDNGRQADDPQYVSVSQDLSTTFGKVLRIDVRPDAGDAYPDDPDRNYAIPAENPYAEDGDEATLGEVFHSGLRNPWRASFDRATGDLYIGNVGHVTREEVEFARAGEAGIDFGWPSREGTIETPIEAVGGPRGDSRDPIHEYDRGTRGSVTGGYVYRGPVAELHGSYFFADPTRAAIWRGTFERNVDPATFDGGQIEDVQEISAELSALASEQLGEAVVIDNIVSFGEDNAGNLYLIDFGATVSQTPLGTGQIYRIVPAFLSGDYDSSGTVEQADLDLVLLNWGQATPPLPSGWEADPPTGVVDQQELDRVLLNWGSVANAASETAVPEPGSLWLLVVGLVIEAARTRRARGHSRLSL